MNLYNIEKLIRVKVSRAYVSRCYELREEIKFLGITLQKTGVYNTIFDYYSGSVIPDNLFIKHDVLYEKPQVTLYYQDGHEKSYRFEDYENAKQFAEEITREGKFIE